MSTTRIVRVESPTGPYDVVIGSGVLASAGELIGKIAEPCKVALVVDDAVGPTYGMTVDTSLARAGYDVTAVAVPSGESSKNWALAGELLEGLASARLGRDSMLLALGGGVIGDLAGFAAAVYLRGIRFVQVPTTLLAMVDSSVGGKTAVDLRAGKNLAGAFKQPLVVLADTDTLQTLPHKEWGSGLAEAAKSAVLDGEEFLAWLERRADAIAPGTGSHTPELVERCVRFKAGVVASDETEEGPRECLNYGHTFGHALEKVLGYGTITHGAAVAEGIRFAARVSMDVGACDAEFVRRQDHLLDALGLASLGVSASPSALLDAMRSDKKVRGGAVRMVLASAPGVWQCVAVDDRVVRAHIDAWASTK